MNIKVVRLKGLPEDRVREFGQVLRRAIREDKTTWVCQRSDQPHFWGNEYLLEIAAGLRTDTLHAWIAVADGVPAGVCMVVEGKPTDWFISLFVVDPRKTPQERLEIADTQALVSLKEMLGWEWPTERNLVTKVPKNSEASHYCDICDFEMVSEDEDLETRRISMKALRDNILKRQRSG